MYQGGTQSIQLDIYGRQAIQMVYHLSGGEAKQARYQGVCSRKQIVTSISAINLSLRAIKRG